MAWRRASCPASWCGDPRPPRPCSPRSSIQTGEAWPETPARLIPPSAPVGLRSPAGALGFAPHRQERGAPMYDLHYWPTPNGKKVTILLEELGVPYRIVPVHIGRGDQFTD